MARTVIVLLVLLIAAPARVAAQPIEVDLELLLMVDVSRSMSPNELEIQRRGYASALASAEVYAAMRSGLLGRIALAYVEWAGSQHVVVGWQMIETREDLQAFADRVTASFNPALRRTSISEALFFGAGMIAGNDYQGLRRVIDISGDGPNNAGRRVTYARDLVVAQGITINGLPLLTSEGLGSQWHLDQLDIYYRTCVIGGPGAFVIPVLDWVDFAEAVRRKLVLEIAARPQRARVFRAQMIRRDPTDCLIGEKIWNERRRMMGDFNGP